LQVHGIAPERIHGYAVEEYTHMAVAVAVQSGAADAGLGIFSAAKALGLDFIPVVTEQYDLIIPERDFKSDRIQALLTVIRSPEFKVRVAGLGGYSTKRTGEIIL
jgi:putative molybdopterin biosynthesis protein